MSDYITCECGAAWNKEDYPSCPNCTPEGIKLNIASLEKLLVMRKNDFLNTAQLISFYRKKLETLK